jgi:hypothetical protein
MRVFSSLRSTEKAGSVLAVGNDVTKQMQGKTYWWCGGSAC